MVSDAVSTGRTVRLVPIRPTRLGSAYMAAIHLLMPGGRMYPRDLRHFWMEVTRCGFASFSEAILEARRIRRSKRPSCRANSGIPCKRGFGQIGIGVSTAGKRNFYRAVKQATPA